MTRTLALAGTAALLSLACSPGSDPGSSEAAKGEARKSAGSDSLNAALAPIAEAYVKLVLAVGEHDGDYVDAYYGPEEWRESASEPVPLAQIRQEVLGGDMMPVQVVKSWLREEPSES